CRFLVHNFSYGGCVFFYLINDSRSEMMSKTILITGSSRGLGASIAKTLGRQGHHVIINYFQNKALAEKVVDELGHEQAIAIRADVTDSAQVDLLIAEGTNHFGIRDAVVNDARIGVKFDPSRQKSCKDLMWSEYQQLIDGNLKGAFNVTHGVIDQFIEQKSGII